MCTCVPSSAGSRPLRKAAVTSGVKKQQTGKISKGGFGGAKTTATESKSVGTGVKALKAQYESFVSLKKEGAKLYDVFVRGSGKKTEWEKVGAVCAENDDAHAAVQIQLALILEHAEVVSPAFMLLRGTLEAGWRAAPEEAKDGSIAEEATLEATGEDITALERKAIPQGSVKAGYRNLVPINLGAAKAAM